MPAPVVLLLLAALGLWAQTAQPMVDQALAVDVALAESSPPDRLLVFVTLTNRSPTDALTTIALRVGPGKSGDVTRAVPDLSSGQATAEQIDLDGSSTTAYVFVTYVRNGQPSSLARAAALSAPSATPNALISPLLAGGFGILGVILGQLGAYVLARWRAVDDARHSWLTTHAQHFRAFSTAWDRQPEVAALRREYNLLRGQVEIPRSVRTAYDTATRVFGDPQSTEDQKRDAAESLQRAIDQLFARYGPPLDQ